MADEAKDKDKGEEAKDQPAAKPKSNKKMLIIIGAAVVVVIAIGLTAFLLLRKTGPQETMLSMDAAGSADDSQLEAQGGVSEDELEEDDQSLGGIFPLEAMVVNLSGGGFLRCQIQFEFISRDIPSRFYSKLTPIKDALITALAAKRREDISNKEGRDDLKVDIREIVNDLLKREEIKNVYFTQFLIQ